MFNIVKSKSLKTRFFILLNFYYNTTSSTRHMFNSRLRRLVQGNQAKQASRQCNRKVVSHWNLCSKRSTRSVSLLVTRVVRSAGLKDWYFASAPKPAGSNPIKSRLTCNIKIFLKNNIESFYNLSKTKKLFLMRQTDWQVSLIRKDWLSLWWVLIQILI